jgi:hypothetical protein
VPARYIGHENDVSEDTKTLGQNLFNVERTAPVDGKESMAVSFKPGPQTVKE